MVDDPSDSARDPEPERHPGGLSWEACLGAAAGLMLGVVIAMLLSALFHWWMPETRAAEILWEIAAPLLGITGVIAGSMAFSRLLQERVWLAFAMFLLMLVLGLILVFTVGFPWREAA